MSANLPKHLQSFSVVADAELRLLHQLRDLCRPFASSHGVVLRLYGGGTVDAGAIADVLAELTRL